MKNLTFLIFILWGIPNDIPKNNSIVETTRSINKIEIGTFDNYAFVVDGKIIDRNQLIDFPDIEIFDIYPFYKTIEGKEYKGAIYFNTNEQQTQSVRFAEDPAWFINGIQVSSFNIRETYPEYYTRIVKSTKDTIIENKLYRGSIHITTDENYFDIRTSLAQLLVNYREIDPNQTTLFWYRSIPFVANIPDISMFQNNLSINYLDKGDEEKVKIDSLQFAGGKRIILQVVNGGNRFSKPTLYGSSNKAITIFNDPLMVDAECTCYLSNFNKDSVDIFESVELMPRPYDGEENYLNKLATTLELSTEKTSAVQDSISIRFLVSKLGLLSNLESHSPNTTSNASILRSIKKNSCLWTPGVQSGRFVYTSRQMKIFYSKDEKGNIYSLDKIEYKKV